MLSKRWLLARPEWFFNSSKTKLCLFTQKKISSQGNLSFTKEFRAVNWIFMCQTLWHVDDILKKSAFKRYYLLPYLQINSWNFKRFILMKWHLINERALAEYLKNLKKFQLEFENARNNDLQRGLKMKHLLMHLKTVNNTHQPRNWFISRWGLIFFQRMNFQRNFAYILSSWLAFHI